MRRFIRLLLILNAFTSRRRFSIMANGTIAFDTLSTSGQISGTAKSVDTDYLASGVKVWCNHEQAASYIIHDSLNVSSVTDGSCRNGKSSPY